MKKQYARLNIREIRPEGWLEQQLRIQMNGLTGMLYDIWDSVGSYSGWLGGTGDGWERVPYYLDGLLPLSWHLNDKKHWDLCLRFIEWTLNSQDENGNYGPVDTKGEQWARFQMLKVLIQYAELTGDDRVAPFTKKYLTYVAELGEKTPIREWSRARIPDLLYTGKWLYERTGDEEILELLRRIDSYSLDWCDFLDELPFPRPTSYYINWKNLEATENREFLDDIVPYHYTHIVNVTMGFKHPALRGWLFDDAHQKEIARRGIEDVIKAHGVPSGCINGDEHLAGPNPVHGSELCSVVEYMFSLQSLLEVFGDPWYADQMERLAYNALPATITEDFMGHQYLQQANQVLSDFTKRPWFNNGEASNTYGLEPNFGCCTANMHQAWPKFVNSLWFSEGEDTLVSMVFAPCIVETGTGPDTIRIRLETGYPFRDTLTYHLVKIPEGKRKQKIKVRIPGWCTAPEVTGNDYRMEEGFLVFSEGLKAGDYIQIRFPMEVRYSNWYHNSRTVERGPLVYGLDIQERWEVCKEVAGVKDYCVYPESPWNYALNEDLNAEVEESNVGEKPFSGGTPAVRIRVSAKKLPCWKMDGGNAGDLPQSPVTVNEAEERILLIPFGNTKLRISEFPWYKKKGEEEL